MLNRQKNVNDVRGAKIGCPNFSPCPLCFGCRSYSSANIECIECRDAGVKFNLCNKSLHTNERVALFITKNNITL